LKGTVLSVALNLFQGPTARLEAAPLQNYEFLTQNTGSFLTIRCILCQT